MAILHEASIAQSEPAFQANPRKSGMYLSETYPGFNGFESQVIIPQLPHFTQSTVSSLLENTQAPEFDRGISMDVTAYWHQDLQWTANKKVGYEQARSTARTLVHLLDVNPDLTAVFPQVAVLEYLEQAAPNLFEKVVHYINNGRLEPVSGCRVQPDLSIPSGEALLRQLYEGQEYLLRKTGKIAKTGWFTDVFGLPPELARYLRLAGMENLVFKRGEKHQVSLPGDIFRLVASDLSEVTAEHVNEYGTWLTSLPRHLRYAAENTRSPFKRKLVLIGVGDHGGGPTQMDIDTNRAIDLSDQWPRSKFLTVEEHFDAIRREVPKEEIPVHTEGSEYPNGCWSSNAKLKQQYRTAEQSLIKSEVQTAQFRKMIGKKYVQGIDLRQEWRNISDEQEHDTICGTSIEEAVAETFGSLGGVIETANKQSLIATHGIGEQLDTAENDKRIVNLMLYNNTGHPIRQFVTAMIEQSDPAYYYPDYTKSHMLYDSKGNIIPMQNTPATSQPSARPGFVAYVEPGYTRWKLVPKPEGIVEYKDYHKIAHKVVVENEQGEKETRYRLENDTHQWDFDAKTGALAKIYDRNNDYEVLSGPASLPMLYHDKHDAWGAERYDQLVEGAEFIPTSFRLVHDGPVMSAFEVKHMLIRDGKHTKTTVKQEFQLCNDLPTLTVNTEVNFDEDERKTAILLGFPIHIKNYPEVRYEIPNAFTLRKTDGYQMPAQTWVNLEGITDYNRPLKDGGRRIGHNVTVANNGKYGYLSTYDHNQRQATLRMVIARGNPYTYFEGEVHNPGQAQKKLENSAAEVAGDDTSNEIEALSLVEDVALDLETTKEKSGFQDTHHCDLEKKEPAVMDKGIHNFSYTITPAFGGWRAALPHRRGDELNRPIEVQQESSHIGTQPATNRSIKIGRDNIGLSAMKPAQSGDGTIVRLVERHMQKEDGVPITIFDREFVRDFRPFEMRTVLVPYDETIPIIDVDLLEWPIIHSIEGDTHELPKNQNGHRTYEELEL